MRTLPLCLSPTAHRSLPLVNGPGHRPVELSPCRLTVLTIIFFIRQMPDHTHA